MTSDESYGTLVGVLAAVLLAGCAALPTARPRIYLDERTSATVTVGGPIMVFARERPELAVYARDYLTLVPIDVNRSGTHVQYFYGYAWSTIDKRGVEDSVAVPRFELLADGRRIPLLPVPGHPSDLGIGDPPLPVPARSAQALLSVTTTGVQDFVARADQIVAIALRDDAAEPFALWSR